MNMTYATSELQLKLFKLRKAVLFKSGDSWKDFCEIIGLSPTIAKKIHQAEFPETVKIYKSSQDQLEAAYRKWFDD